MSLPCLAWVDMHVPYFQPDIARQCSAASPATHQDASGCNLMHSRFRFRISQSLHTLLFDN